MQTVINTTSYLQNNIQTRNHTDTLIGATLDIYSDMYVRTYTFLCTKRKDLANI